MWEDYNHHNKNRDGRNPLTRWYLRAQERVEQWMEDKARREEEACQRRQPSSSSSPLEQQQPQINAPLTRQQQQHHSRHYHDVTDDIVLSLVSDSILGSSLSVVEPHHSRLIGTHEGSNSDDGDDDGVRGGEDGNDDDDHRVLSGRYGAMNELQVK